MSHDRDSAHVTRVGCSGWNYAHWRHGVFYPERLPPARWLAHYARFFGTVELNNTFYRLPRTAAVERWVEETPAGFVFAVKVSRYVTHVKRLADAGVHLPLLLERIRPLVRSPKLGPLLWQLPPTFRRDDDRLRTALDAFPPGLRHAVEFRHESWFADDVLSMLRERNVALVVAGDSVPEPTADFVYVRFHRGKRGVRGNYSPRELDEWADRVRGWGERGDVFAYFNNDWEGFAVRNALGLMERLGLQSERACGDDARRAHARSA